MRTSSPLVATSLFVLLIGCASSEPSRSSSLGEPVVQPDVVEPQEQEWDPWFGPQTNRARIVEFCQQIKSKTTDRQTIAILPLVYSDRTDRTDNDPKPWVIKQGGVDVARELAGLLADAMPEMDVLSPQDVALRLDDEGIGEPTSFRNAAGARDGAKYIGVQLMLFGSIVKKRIGASSATQLEFSLEVVAKDNPIRALSRKRLTWTVTSRDRAAANLFTSMNAESNWIAAERLPIEKPAQPDFEREQAKVAKVSANRLGRMLKSEWDRLQKKLGSLGDGAAPEGVPGDDSIATDESLAELSPNVLVLPANFAALAEQQERRDRAAREFKREKSRLDREAREANKPLDYEQPVTVDSVRHATLEEARQYLSELTQRVEESNAGAFCAKFSRDIEAVVNTGNRNLLPSNVLDRVDKALVTETLKSGRIAEQEELMQRLRDKGLGTVIVPYLEFDGADLRVRARFVNMLTPDEVGIVLTSLDGAYKDDLRKALL